MARISDLPDLPSPVEGGDVTPLLRAGTMFKAPASEIVGLGAQWAEGTQPGGPGTKSAREHSLDAGVAAAFAEEFAGPAYFSQAAGEASTVVGQFFRVWNGDNPRTYTRYERTVGGSAIASPLATSAALASSGGAALIGDGNGTTMQAAIDFARDRGLRLSTEFGDRGPSYDNTAAISDWLDYVVNMNGKRGVMLAPWHAEVAGTLNFSSDDFTGVTLLGVEGLSAIRNDGAFSILRIGDAAGLTIEGMGFISDYVNATEDGGSALLCSYANVRDWLLRRCYFSNPNSFTSAVTLYTNTVASPATVRQTDGFVMEECTLDRVGRICLTLMNRYTGSDAPEKMRRIRLRNNVVLGAGWAAPAYDTGLPGILHGMFVSYDGAGSDFQTTGNYLSGLQGLGIEVAANSAGWHGGKHTDNMFGDMTRKVNMFSFDDAVGAGVIRDQYIARNKPVGALTGALHSNWFGLDGTSKSEQNTYATQADQQVILCRRLRGFVSERDRFVNTNALDGRYGLLLDTTSTDCRIIDPEVNMLGVNAGVAFSGIRFSAAGTTRNVVEGDNIRILKNSGGLEADEITGAAGNVVGPFTTATNNKVQAYLSYAMPDADTTLTSSNALFVRKLMRLTGTLTAARKLTFPSRMMFEQGVTFTIRNDCNWPVTPYIGAVAGDTIYPGDCATLTYDNALGSVRGDHISQPGFLGTFATTAAMPSAAGSGKGAKAWANTPGLMFVSNGVNQWRAEGNFWGIYADLAALNAGISAANGGGGATAWVTSLGLKFVSNGVAWKPEANYWGVFADIAALNAGISAATAGAGARAWVTSLGRTFVSTGAAWKPEANDWGSFANLAELNAVATSAASAGAGARAQVAAVRNAGEGAGAGTGSLVTSDGSNWRVPGVAGAAAE